MRHITMSTIETTAFQMKYRSVITASTDLDRFIIEFSHFMAPRLSTVTN